jgi:hypothetical protein
MPASWANAFSPTIALFGCTWMPVMWESSREVRKSSSVFTRSRRRRSRLRVRSAITISLERGVARPLADAVDRALDLARAVITPVSELATACRGRCGSARTGRLPSCR